MMMVMIVVVMIVLVFRLRTAPWTDIGRNEVICESRLCVFCGYELDPDPADTSNFCACPFAHCILYVFHLVKSETLGYSKLDIEEIVLTGFRALNISDLNLVSKGDRRDALCGIALEGFRGCAADGCLDLVVHGHIGQLEQGRSSITPASSNDHGRDQ